MKKFLLFLSILLCFLALHAHEFWLLPQRFNFQLGDTAVIRFNVGENFTGNNWSGDSSRIASLLYYTGDESKDISNLVSGSTLSALPLSQLKRYRTDISSLVKAKGDSIILPLTRLGTQMVTFQSTPAFIKMEADKFNAYLKEDGLKDAFEYRKKDNGLKQPATEKYTRSVKTIFQVGQLKTNTSTQQTNLLLDIVPLKIRSMS